MGCYGAVTYNRSVADFYSLPQRRWGYRFSREKPEGYKKRWEEGLCFLGFRMEVRIRNDTPTFNTAYLAGVVFLLRDAIVYEAPVSTDTGRALWEDLRWCIY